MKVAMERIAAWRRLVASGLAACAVAMIASTASVAATGSGTNAVIGAQTGAAPDTMGPHSTVPYGVYDQGGDFSNDPYVQIEHIFMPWEDVSLTSLQRADAYALARHRALLVTIEPWTWSKSERNTPAALIRGIFDGSYDKNMSTICSELGSLRSPVTVRWAQEMDNKHRFIWSGWKPATYIAAYRRMIDICRAVAPSIRYMWSPLGNEDMAKYYPGDNYVDIVGISVFGYQPYDRGIYGHDRDFYEIMGPRYARAAQFGKPVVVAELGYSGDQAYVDKWTDEIRNIGNRYPQLVGLVYFNYPELYPWPHGYGKPDWRIHHRVIKLPNS
ncbi:MAG: glycosyl hydrolase [Allgaiera sp.]|jgi:endoglucanase|nr:glycosyl hydrolase [Allgaiera sp.]